MTSLAPHQLQRWTRTERGQSLALGTCAPTLAVDHSQDRPGMTLRAGYLIRMVTSNSSLGASVTCRAAPCRQRPAFYSPCSIGANRPRTHSLPHQYLFQNIAGVRVVHRRRLSLSASLAGSINASKRGQGLGNFTHRLGTIIQGQGRHD